MDGLFLAGQSVMHVFFTGRLTGKKPKILSFAVYFFMLCVIQCLKFPPSLSGILSAGMGVLALYSISRFLLKNQKAVSWLAAVLAFYISQLSFGIINSVEAAVFPYFIGNQMLSLLVWTALAAFFALCCCCYAAVLRLLPRTENAPYILLFPGLFFFAAELYILHTSYSFITTSFSLEEAGKHSVLLFLQLMGLAALFCALYAYRQICQGFQTQAQLRSLTQAAQAQKIYIAEAQMRYEQTKAFRHDIKNHLSVLNGLLNSGKTDESKAYLKKLETVSESLSFPYQTGNPVVDILLGEKLRLTKEVMLDISVCLPDPCGIDDLDLCVIFANALDNAINACRFLEGEKTIRIMGKRQGDFYLLIFENTCSGEPLPPAGTGLSNIKAAAEKYHGAVLAEKTGQVFSLHVLLNISLHPKNISAQKP